jgi:hypothetical protein
MFCWVPHCLGPPHHPPRLPQTDQVFSPPWNAGVSQAIGVKLSKMAEFSK